MNREALATGTGSAAALSERVARTEKQVEMLTAQMQAALAASRQHYIRQHGKVAAIVLLTEDKTLYPINSPELGAGDRAKLDELGTRLKAARRNTTWTSRGIPTTSARMTITMPWAGQGPRW